MCFPLLGWISVRCRPLSRPHLTQTHSSTCLQASESASIACPMRDDSPKTCSLLSNHIPHLYVQATAESSGRSAKVGRLISSDPGRIDITLPQRKCELRNLFVVVPVSSQETSEERAKFLERVTADDSLIKLYDVIIQDREPL